MTVRSARGPEGTGHLVPSFIGGPLHQLGASLGLVDTSLGRSTALGMVIAGVLWGGIVLLALVIEQLDGIFALAVIGGHVRLLVAIPLFFACESTLTLHLRCFTEGLHRTGIVPSGQKAPLDRAVRRFNLGVASASAEFLCVVLAMLPAWMPADMHALGSTALARHGSVQAVELWYWYVCLPVFRFLLLRWLWRLAVWSMFLWRVSRLDLHLVAIHPDRVAGLGYLAVVQASFSLLIAATSAVIAASIAEDITATGATLTDFYYIIFFVVFVYGMIFVVPLYAFSGQLRLARAHGLADYMDFATNYVMAFEAKWTRAKIPEGESLGTSDLQSLADLGNSVRVVEEIGFSPVNRTLLVVFATAALGPMLPLLLIQFPMNEIAERVLLILFGG